MTGYGYLFPTFTMRAAAEPGRFAGLQPLLDDVVGEVTRQFALTPDAFQSAEPEETLTATQTLQRSVGMFAESVACARWAEAHVGPASHITSFSMGMFAACVHAGSLSVADAVQLLVRIHHHAEAKAPARPFTLTAVIGPAGDVVSARCTPASEVEISGAYGRVVHLICGPSDAIERWITAFGVDQARFVSFPIAIPFHTSWLAGDDALLRQIVGDVELVPPRMPIVSSSTAKMMATSGEVADELVRNIASPIQWRGALDALQALGVDRFVECGFTRELGDLLRRDEGEHIEVHQFVPSTLAGAA